MDNDNQDRICTLCGESLDSDRELSCYQPTEKPRAARHRRILHSELDDSDIGEEETTALQFSRGATFQIGPWRKATGPTSVALRTSSIRAR
jgi:hypothetical protein